MKPTELEELPCITQPELEEIGEPVGLQELDLSGMHLGMGGWENHDAHPRCWQMEVSEDWQALVRWAERTLQSAREQFQAVRATEIAV